MTSRRMSGAGSMRALAVGSWIAVQARLGMQVSVSAVTVPAQ